MAEGGVTKETLSQAMKKKEELEESEKSTKEQLELREKQMQSISQVENDIDDLLAFAKKAMSKKIPEDIWDAKIKMHRFVTYLFSIYLLLHSLESDMQLNFEARFLAKKN